MTRASGRYMDVLKYGTIGHVHNYTTVFLDKAAQSISYKLIIGEYRERYIYVW